MDITKYMHMKNRHCSHIFLAEGSCIAPRGHGGSITFKLYDLLVAGGLFRTGKTLFQRRTYNIVTRCSIICCIFKVMFVLINLFLWIMNSLYCRRKVAAVVPVCIIISSLHNFNIHLTKQQFTTTTTPFLLVVLFTFILVINLTLPKSRLRS